MDEQRTVTGVGVGSLVMERPAVSEAGPPVVAGRSAGRRARSVSVLVVVVALAAGLWAVVASRVVFPQLSSNDDEAVYLLQADALRQGHLFPPAAAPAEAFRPWLSVVRGARYVPKYTPVHAGIIAAARWLVGTDRAALFLIAALVVLSGSWLAWEVVGSARVAVAAAGLLALSPLFLIQSATYLSYLSTLAFLQGFAAAFVRGTRRGSPRWVVVAGLLAEVAAFARPFDAVLVSGPWLAWWAWSRRHQPRRLLGDAGWLAVGAAVPLVAMAAYFSAATGSPLRSPFSLLDAKDTLGFGARRMFAAQPATAFTLQRGVLGVVRHLVVLSFWSAGGLILIGLAGRALRHLRGPARALAATAVTVPAGYLFFWGIYGATQWGGPWRFGPFYLVPVLSPLTVLGAAGLVRLWRADRLLGAAAVAAMVVVSGFVTAKAVAANGPFREERQRLFAPLAGRTLDNAVVFLPDLQGPWLLHPFGFARNGDFDGKVIWARDRGDDANRAVLRSFPTRAAYRLTLRPAPGMTADRFEVTPSLEPFPRTPRAVDDDPLSMSRRRP